MGHKEHSYTIQVTWTGNLGQGTRTYRGYSRNHEISAPGKISIPGSADPAFRGDPTRYNPEELLVSTLSSCHMLWYLHLCADAKITVLAYSDQAAGVMVEQADGSGYFREVVLRPCITIEQGGDVVLAERLHEQAHRMCFIASSVNFSVRCEPSIRVQPALEPQSSDQLQAR